FTYDGARRPVTCSCTPNTADAARLPSALRNTTPGDPRMSSGVPYTPSGPGFTTPGRPARERPSPPPEAGWWQLPHAMVREDETCSSQNSALPRYAFAAVTALPCGCGGGGSG